MTLKIRDLFLSLVRLGIGHTDSTNFIDKVDWEALKALADKHGLSAVVLDGLNEVSKSNSQLSTLNTQLKLSWIGEVMQNYEQRYVQYENAIASLAGWYTQHGYKMMVLKGYACSLDWPNLSIDLVGTLTFGCSDSSVMQMLPSVHGSRFLLKQATKVERMNQILRLTRGIIITRYLSGKDLRWRIITTS